MSAAFTLTRPQTTPPPAPAAILPVDDLARLDARYAALDAEYIRLGNLLRGMDREMADLRARRKQLAKGRRRA